MHLHHDKHHAAYVNNLNTAVEGTPFANMSIDELVRNLNMVPEDKRTAVRNNGGGHYNHSMFWEIMRPGGGGAPQGAIAPAIDDAFGGFDALKDCSSTRRASAASAPAGPGSSSGQTASSPSPPPRTRTTR